MGQDAQCAELGALTGQRRRAAHLTQRQLAERCGVSIGAVRDLEQGRTTLPRPGLMDALAQVLGLDIGRPARARSMGLRIGVLGPLALWRDGVQAGLGTRRQRAVLGLLAANPGRSLHREAIIDLIWPENPPRNAVVMVQSYISLLRAILSTGPQAGLPQAGLAGERAGRPGIVIACDGGSYRLRLAGGQLDLLEFADLATSGRRAASSGDYEAACQSYERAAGLWRGEPLADVDLLRGHPAVTGLARRRTALILSYAEVASAAGWHERVLGHLRELADRDRLDERVHARLMIALAGSGQQAAALGVFEEIRHRLADELGVGPGPDLSDAHARVLRGTIPCSRHSVRPVVPFPRREPDAPVVRVPRQLPPATRHFVGRTHELEELTRLLDQVSGPAGPAGAAVVSVIGGTAGVGKTALAVHWAHQVASSRFPDGQLYMDLRGFHPSEAPVTAGEAVRCFLDACGIAAGRIPATQQARTGLYRSLLAGKQMLIVLDNARDASQVRPLLPASSGCLVLVTTRRRLTGLAATEGAQLLTLDALTGVDATELLERRLGAQCVACDQAAVSELAELCARLPLALAITAARAAARPRFPLAALAAELRNTRDRLDALDTGDTSTSLRAVFSWSYQQLAERPARMFRLLGVHPGPDISVPAAASLAGIPGPQARRALDELTGAHLLAERAPGRFSFHDLLRAYAADQARAHSI